MINIEELLLGMGFVKKQCPFTGRHIMGLDSLQDPYGMHPPEPNQRFQFDIDLQSFKDFGLNLPEIDVKLEARNKIIQYMNISEFFDKNKL